MPDRPENAFLRGLPPESFDLLSKLLTPLRLRLGEVLVRTDDPSEWVYFPLSAVLSNLTTGLNGRTVETAMGGNEGGVGVVEALGSGVASMTTIVQVDGKAARLPAKAFRTLAFQDPGIMRQCLALMEVQMAESRQSGLCQALHPVDRRFARWIMESVDRSGGRMLLPLTQEFIASMLGVQRTTVSGFATELQKGGLIRYRRGQIEVVDPGGLEQRACECRRVTVAQRRRLGLEPLAATPEPGADGDAG